MAAADVEGGAALTFMSTGDVAELRRQVQSMADTHNLHHRAGGVMIEGDTAHPHPDHDWGRMMGNAQIGGNGQRMVNGEMVGNGRRMPAASASVEDLDEGARLIFRATDPSALDTLRDNVRARAAIMGNGDCPTISDDNVKATLSPAIGANEHGP